MEKEKVAPKKKSSANINDWAKALMEKYPYLARVLDEDKMEGIRGLEELDLPRYRKIETTLSDFMDHAEEYMEEIGSKKYYITLVPKMKGPERFGKADLDREGVMNYIGEYIKPEDVDKYNIALQQYFENLYGGSITIGQEKNQFVAEMKRGMMSGIASGYVTPEFTITRDNSGIFHYPDNFNDPKAQKEMFRAFHSIPHDGGDADMRFTPGYYEFAIVRDDEGMVRPIFTDYRRNPSYQINWEKLGPNPPKKFEPDE